ncbi:MAG: type II CAAX prenyl endopeptidase Rce1 family protein [Candidatus Hodarchaeota archaeon]
MSKEDNKETKLKFCVYCGAKLDEEKAYCPKCGKLVIKIKPSIEKGEKTGIDKQIQVKEKKIISRKCSGCGSVINSPILEQCPICNTKLEKLPPPTPVIPTRSSQTKTGFIFTSKKLEPEQKYVLKKDIWNFREGLSVFFNSIMAYITIRLLIIMLFTFQFDQSIDISITTILLSQIPEIIFGVYPLWYIYSKKHNFKKLGFSYELKTFLIAIIIGTIAGIGLLVFNFFSNNLIELMYNAGIDFYDILGYLAEENQVIRNADILWIILLMLLLSLSSFSTEIVFRGVLHNTLRERFEKDLFGRISVILLVALIYSGIFLLFSIPIGIYFFLINFVIFIIFGIIYEINHNIYNTIIASIFYNLLLILILVFL